MSLLSLSIRGQTEWKPQSQKLIKWTTALSNLVKLWAMPCRAPQDGWIMVESSGKTWSTGEGNGKPLHYSCFENPMSSMKRQKDKTLKDELPRLEGPNMLLEISGEITPERMKRQSQSKSNTQLWMWLVMEVKSDALKNKYCIETWNVRSMNQGKLEVVKQEMARVNTDILGISELKWTGMGEWPLCLILWARIP